MPHQQPRTRPTKSPPNIDPVLEAIAGLGISLNGVTGSNMEFTGEIGFLVEDDADIRRIRDTLRDQRYPVRVVGERQGLHLDYVDDVSGGLLATMARARAHHPRGQVSDIAVGVRTWGFQLAGTEVVRDQKGDPVPGGDQRLPVQILFIQPTQRDDEGQPVGGDDFPDEVDDSELA